eukprot:4584529-Alexandrium_andersonii.AAC.1
MQAKRANGMCKLSVRAKCVVVGSVLHGWAAMLSLQYNVAGTRRLPGGHQAATRRPPFGHQPKTR